MRGRDLGLLAIVLVIVAFFTDWRIFEQLWLLREELSSKVAIVIIDEGSADRDLIRLAARSWREAGKHKAAILVFSDLTNMTHHEDFNASNLLPLSQIFTEGGNFDPIKLLEISTRFAASQSCEYLFFTLEDLILPPNFFDLVITLFQSSDATSAIGIKLDCSFNFSPTRFLSGYQNLPRLELFAQRCAWSSIIFGSYLFVRLGSSISGRVIDLSPTVMPLQSQSSINLYSPKWKLNLMEQAIYNLTNNASIVEVQNRVCPLSNGAEIRRFYPKTTMPLPYYWVAGGKPWISPFRLGADNAARKFGCQGLRNAILFDPIWEDLLLIGERYKEMALLHRETNPDLRAIAKRMFPLKNTTNMSCTGLSTHCIVHKDGTLMYGTVPAAQYTPLITHILRNNLTRNADGSMRHSTNFVMCVERLDWFTKRFGDDTETVPFIWPVFDNSFCFSPPSNVAGDEEGFKGFDRFIGLQWHYNFINKDHPGIAAGITTRVDYLKKDCTISFDDRKPLAVFRGSLPEYVPRTGCDLGTACTFANEVERSALEASSRVALVLWSKARPWLLDAKFSELLLDQLPKFRDAPGYAAMFEKSKIPANDYYCKYQVAVVLKGFGTAFRAIQHFKSEQCVVLQHGECFEWFYPFLKPWIHYVPFRADLSDLGRNLQILKRTPGLAKVIAHNGKIFYDKYLSWDAITNITTYILEVLMDLYEYNNLSCSNTWAFAYQQPMYDKQLRCEEGIRNFW